MTPSPASPRARPDAPTCHSPRSAPPDPAETAPDARLIVTGNPNVGKSVIFQCLTGRYATVSNYPGTTVGISRGTTSLDGRSLHVSDTPGLNSLQAASEDELVARDLLLEEHAVIVQVGDAKNLLRTLALTLELAEIGARAVLTLHMIDEARERRELSAWAAELER